MAANFPTAHAYCTRKYTICPAPKFAAIYLSCPRARSGKNLGLVRIYLAFIDKSSVFDRLIRLSCFIG
ncbi:MAG: hypothetical protein FWC34_00610, partial [Bacteroidetes bacterium]|nr:hypothetical protein [Bacteroidota bacterium]